MRVRHDGIHFVVSKHAADRHCCGRRAHAQFSWIDARWRRRRRSWIGRWARRGTRAGVTTACRWRRRLTGIGGQIAVLFIAVGTLLSVRLAAFALLRRRFLAFLHRLYLDQSVRRLGQKLNRAVRCDLSEVERRANAYIRRCIGLGGLRGDTALIHTEQQRAVDYLQCFPVRPAHADNGQRRRDPIGRTIHASDAPRDRTKTATHQAQVFVIDRIAIFEVVVVDFQFAVRTQRQQRAVGEAHLGTCFAGSAQRLTGIDIGTTFQIACDAIGANRLDDAGGHQHATRTLGRCGEHRQRHK